MSQSIVIKNKKADYLYEIHDEYEAGIVLLGSEIKSLRMGKANLVDTYCFFKDNELWVKGMHIAEYKYAIHWGHEAKRTRKLLLTKQELRKISRKTKEKGFTIIALQIYINDSGLAKVKIATARGKTVGDKRESLKKKDAKRDLDRSMR